MGYYPLKSYRPGSLFIFLSQMSVEKNLFYTLHQAVYRLQKYLDLLKDELHWKYGSWDIAFQSLKSVKFNILRKRHLKSKVCFFIKIRKQNLSLPSNPKKWSQIITNIMLLDKSKWKQSVEGLAQAIYLYYVRFFAIFGMLFI